MGVNHVNTEKLHALMDATKKDASAGRVAPKVSGEWLFGDA